MPKGGDSLQGFFINEELEKKSEMKIKQKAILLYANQAKRALIETKIWFAPTKSYNNHDT